MKATERILIKAAIIQFLFLFLTHFFFHQFDTFSQARPLTKYEGVAKGTLTKIVETMYRK